VPVVASGTVRASALAASPATVASAQEKPKSEEPDCAVRPLQGGETRVADVFGLKASTLRVALCPSEDSEPETQNGITTLRIIGAGDKTPDLTKAGKEPFSKLTRQLAQAWAGVKNDEECKNAKPYTQLGDGWNNVLSGLNACQKADAGANYVEYFMTGKLRKVADERYADMYTDPRGDEAKALDRVGKAVLKSDDLRQAIKSGAEDPLRGTAAGEAQAERTKEESAPPRSHKRKRTHKVSW
jgi:hypothetical protein